MKLSKNYILEGYAVKKNSDIEILPLKEEDNKFNNMLTDDSGNSINDDDFIILCNPIIDKLDISPDNATQIKKDVIDFCKGEWARYHVLPSVDKVKDYLIGRNQSFAVN